MCGVLGGYSRSLNLTYDKIKKSLNKIHHRGPDAFRIFQSEDFFVAHKRLAILDTSKKATQPFHIDQSVLVYNGEIYNHLELRKELRYSFTTTCDTETLHRGLETDGIGFLNKCKGMFAGGLLDTERLKLTVFRDPLGIKPLYYYLDQDTFIFSSEIKAILDLLGQEPEVNKLTVQQYLNFENYPQHQTCFKKIVSLRPGEVMQIHLQDDHLSTETKQKTSPQLPPVLSSNYDKCLKEGTKLIESSVESHLLSDVPLAVYMSGGIDSSLVATIARKKSSDILAFTGFFDTKEGFYDERELSRIVAKQNNIPLREVKITPESFIECFDQVVYHLDQPQMGMGSFSQFVVAREVAKHRKVVLTGHGGDELFAGYPLFKGFYLLSGTTSAPKVLEFIKKLKYREHIWVAYTLWNFLKSKKLKFAPQIHNFLISEKDASYFYCQNRKSGLEDLSKYYEEVYLPGLLLVEDKISMAHSLESRVPLWNNELVEWAKTVPIEYKLHDGQLKGLMKDIAANYLPKEVINGPKKGFPTPLRLWFRSELKSFVEERLLAKNPFLDQWVTRSDREKLIKSHSKTSKPFAIDELHAHKIWTLLCLESWQRQFKVQYER